MLGNPCQTRRSRGRSKRALEQEYLPSDTNLVHGTNRTARDDLHELHLRSSLPLFDSIRPDIRRHLWLQSRSRGPSIYWDDSGRLHWVWPHCWDEWQLREEAESEQQHTGTRVAATRGHGGWHLVLTRYVLLLTPACQRCTD